MSTKNSFIHFPLCLLNYSDEIKISAKIILIFGIKNFSKSIELEKWDYDKIEAYCKNNNLKYSEKYSELIFSAIKLNVIISNLLDFENDYRKIKSYINDFESRYGKDCIVRLHVDILFDVISGKINSNLFRVYCAILSIIGKKKFVRITNSRISVRCFGFRSKDIADCEINKLEPLTKRQIEFAVQTLQKKKLLDYFTYKRRLKFFSILYKGNELESYLINSITKNKFQKEIKKLENEKLTNTIDTSIEQMKNQYLTTYKLLGGNFLNVC